MKHEGWVPPPGVPIQLDAAQVERLARYEALLSTRAIRLGMIASGDATRIRERHLFDGLRAVEAVREADRTAYDLGSGAGIPGVVVAIARPHLKVMLVESRQVRAAFLELLVEQLQLVNVEVLAVRVKRLTEAVDVCFARAFAGAPGTWAAAERLLLPGGRLVYFGGRSFDPSELPEDVDVRLVPGLARSGLLVIMSRQ